MRPARLAPPALAALATALVTVALLAAYVTVLLAVSPAEDAVGVLPSLLLAVPVAALFGPARRRLHRAVEGRVVRTVGDPYAPIASLGSTLAATRAAEDVLPDIAATIARTLRAPFVAVELDVSGRLRRSVAIGQEPPHVADIPLRYAGERIGRLLIGRDARSVELSASERQLLAPLAHRVGAVVQNARLAAELREASERLVDARERERHRLRRDLHDGLGPTLASMALQLDVAASGRVELDPVLLDVRGHAQSAVGEIRRLVQELRPPALDELGLVGAIRRQAEAYPPLAVRVEATGFAELPAAVEVAAYRIAVEAVNNAARHANARECVVRLTFNGGLELDVADDGRGIPADARASVGLGSMRERAAELGGVCTIARRSTGGTRVHAVIPIEERA